jgi:hypothetical protein
MQHLLVLLRRARGQLQQSPDPIKVIGGEKAMGSSAVEWGRGVWHIVVDYSRVPRPDGGDASFFRGTPFHKDEKIAFTGQEKGGTFGKLLD